MNSNEEQANASSGGAAISEDGRLVAFGSGATNLVPGEVEDSAFDVFLRDRQAGTTEGSAPHSRPRGGSTPAEVLPFLGEVAALARRARQAGERLYCWICL